MKKLYFFFVLFMVTTLTACTLYMDDKLFLDEARVVRTGTGYLEEETVEMEGNKGTVTYKFNQNTIPIDEEVNQYIEKVESDTILYFKENTPDDLLPVVGEMMTCGFNERFPNAFCHKCIERTEQGDLYRCVFTKCNYDEAFKVLKIHFDDQPLISTDKEMKTLTEEEAEEYYSQFEDDDYEATARSSGPRKIPVNESIAETLQIPISISITLSAGHDLAGVSGTAQVGGVLFLGGHCKGDVSFIDKSADIDVLLTGGIEMTFDIEGTAGATYKSPINGGIGFQFDAKVAGGNLGLVASPYVTINRRAYSHEEYGLGFSAGFRYKRDPNDHEHEWGELDLTRNKAYKYTGKYSPFFLLYKEDGGKEISLTCGIDFNLGLGFEIASGAAEAGLGAGVNMYGKFSTTINKEEYMSADDFQQKNEDFPTYYEGYIGGSVGAAYVSVEPKATFGPFPDKEYKIPFFPESNRDGYISCRSVPEKSFRANVNLLDRGFLSNYWPSKQELRIYDGETKEYITKKDLKWKTRDKTDIAIDGKKYESVLDEYRLTGDFNFPELQYNHEYDGVFCEVFEGLNDHAAFIIENVPFHVAIPDMKIKKATLARVQSASHGATDTEKLDKSIVASKYDPATNKYQWGWVWNGGVYNYRYVVDVDVVVKGHPSYWGFRIYDSSGFQRRKFQVNQVTELNALEKEYKVRLYLYSSKEEEFFKLIPFASVDNHGKAESSEDFTELKTGTFKYGAGMDFPFTTTDGVVYDFLLDHSGAASNSYISE